MSRSKPPAMAAWLLEHLTRKTGNDGLVGDIMEEFNTRHSAAWFWRQVLLAIFARFASNLRRAFFALSFALFWTIGTVLWGHYFFPSQIQSAIRQWVPSVAFAHFQWPLSTIVYVGLWSALTTIPVVAGMSLYIVASKRSSPRRYCFAVLLAFGVQVTTLALPGIAKHSRGSSDAIFLATLFLIIWVAQGPRRDDGRVLGRLDPGS
jgi:hypothetical protein